MCNKVKSQKSKVKCQKSKTIVKFWLLLIAIYLFPIVSNAQCAMCRAAIESEGNGQTAAAINDGIVYLMAVPYVLVGALGFYVYRMYRKNNG